MIDWLRSPVGSTTLPIVRRALLAENIGRTQADSSGRDLKLCLQAAYMNAFKDVILRFVLTGHYANWSVRTSVQRVSDWAKAFAVAVDDILDCTDNEDAHWTNAISKRLARDLAERSKDAVFRWREPCSRWAPVRLVMPSHDLFRHGRA